LEESRGGEHEMCSAGVQQKQINVCDGVSVLDKAKSLSMHTVSS